MVHSTFKIKFSFISEMSVKLLAILLVWKGLMYFAIDSVWSIQPIIVHKTNVDVKLLNHKSLFKYMETTSSNDNFLKMNKE